MMFNFLRAGQAWKKPRFLGYHFYMRLAVSLIGAICLICLPVAASAKSLSEVQVIGKPAAGPDINDAVSEISYGRSDGPAAVAELYFPAQLLPDGDRLLFTEYNSVLRPRYYKLGGALRSVSPAGEVSTLALSKKMSLTADRMTGLAVSGGTAYTTLGESIISLALPGSQPERSLSFPTGGVREAMNAYTLGSEELPYDTIAGEAAQDGNSDGLGPQARFSYPSALALYDDALLVADRDNGALRRVELGSGRSSTLLSSLKSPSGLVQIGDTLYVSHGSGVARLGLDACSGADFQGCSAPNLPISQGATAIARSGERLVILSPSGIYLYDTISGSLDKLQEGSDATASAGGAAVWRGRLYVSDFKHLVIHSYKLDLPDASTVSIKSEATQDGVFLSADPSGALPSDTRYRWKVSAPGCSVESRSSGRLVACPSPRTGQVSVSFWSPGYPERTVSRTIRFR